MKSCFWLLYFVACIQLLPVPIQCARMLINLDFLGIGYDAIQGNPQNDLEDPGFKHPVFLMEYTKSTMTADRQYLIPDNTEAHRISSCGFYTESEVVHDEKSYRDLLSVSIFTT